MRHESVHDLLRGLLGHHHPRRIDVGYVQGQQTEDGELKNNKEDFNIVRIPPYQTTARVCRAFRRQQDCQRAAAGRCQFRHYYIDEKEEQKYAKLKKKQLSNDSSPKIK